VGSYPPLRGTLVPISQSFFAVSCCCLEKTPYQMRNPKNTQLERAKEKLVWKNKQVMIRMICSRWGFPQGQAISLSHHHDIPSPRIPLLSFFAFVMDRSPPFWRRRSGFPNVSTKKRLRTANRERSVILALSCRFCVCQIALYVLYPTHSFRATRAQRKTLSRASAKNFCLQKIHLCRGGKKIKNQKGLPCLPL